MCMCKRKNTDVKGGNVDVIDRRSITRHKIVLGFISNLINKSAVCVCICVRACVCFCMCECQCNPTQKCVKHLNAAFSCIRAPVSNRLHSRLPLLRL